MRFRRDSRIDWARTVSRRSRTPRLRRVSGPVRSVRWLFGLGLILTAVYVAVYIFLDPDWAAPAVGAFIAAGIVLAIVTGQRRVRHHRTLARLIAGTPTEFEETVARMMRGQGFRGVRRTGGAGDLAADVIATDRAGRTVIVQCKRYQPGKTVGSKELQTFIGMQRVHHGADYGIYVTTSRFTRPAQELAAHHDITLVDGDALTAVLANGERAVWMRR